MKEIIHRIRRWKTNHRLRERSEKNNNSPRFTAKRCKKYAVKTIYFYRISPHFLRKFTAKPWPGGSLLYNYLRMRFTEVIQMTQILGVKKWRVVLRVWIPSSTQPPPPPPESVSRLFKLVFFSVGYKFLITILDKITFLFSEPRRTTQTNSFTSIQNSRFSDTRTSFSIPEEFGSADVACEDLLDDTVLVDFLNDSSPSLSKRGPSIFMDSVAFEERISRGKTPHRGSFSGVSDGESIAKTLCVSFGDSPFPC